MTFVKPPLLEAAMRKVLVELELTSCGRTGGRGAGGSGGAFKSMPPSSGDEDPPHLVFEERWEEASTVDDCFAVLVAAREELERITRRQPLPPDYVAETDRERDERMLKQGCGFPPREVILHFDMSERDVRRVRELDGRNPETGEVDDLMKPMPAGSEESREVRMRAMVEAGHSHRRIALVLCVDPSTITRRLQRIVRDSVKAA